MINLNKSWADTRWIVDVEYVGFYNDGSPIPLRQSCLLPWEGRVDAAEFDVIRQAQGYFDAKYGEGSDKVVTARLRDRGAKASIGADAVNRAFQ